MASEAFPLIQKIQYEGPKSFNSMAFKDPPQQEVLPTTAHPLLT